MKWTPTVLLLVVSGLVMAAPPIIREPGVIYFSDLGLQPMNIKVVVAGSCFFDAECKRPLGTLRAPQIAKLEAIASNGFLRVRGEALQGGVVAWADPAHFEPLPPQFSENIRKADDRRQKVEALIAKNDVAIGMTPDEVLRSIGKPQKKSSRATKEGVQQIWEYIKYAVVPQTTYVPVVSQSSVQYYPQSTPRPLQGQVPVLQPTSQPITPQSVQNILQFQRSRNQPASQQIQPQPMPIQQGIVQQNVSGYIPSTIYTKVPSGTISLSFKDNVVEAIDQSEGNLSGGQVSIVIPPINVYR